MAKQTGIIKIQGTIDDLTFAKTQDGYIIRKKASVNKQRIASGSNYLRTRENMSEFSHAGKAGKLLRRSLSSLLKTAKDNRVTSRLVKSLFDVIKSDTASARGSRNVIKGDISLLKGFDFNSHSPFSSTVNAPYRTTIDRPSGLMKVHFPAFVPTGMIKAPQGATHFKIVSAGTIIDFDTETSIIDVQESAVLPWNSEETADLDLTSTLPSDTTLPMLLVVGIQFFQQMNGEYYVLSNGAYNALNLVEVLKS